jgi:hypothetical protein
MILNLSSHNFIHIRPLLLLMWRMNIWEVIHSTNSSSSPRLSGAVRKYNCYSFSLLLDLSNSLL